MGADPRGKETGSEVVRWILRRRPAIDRIIVHSLNETAAGRMVQALGRGGYAVEYRGFLGLVETWGAEEQT